MVLGSTQPLTEMSTSNIPGGKGRPARKAYNLTTICQPIVSKNVGAPTSHNSMYGPSRPVNRDSFNVYNCNFYIRVCLFLVSFIAWTK
jgi:hypothetical protein